MRGSYSESRSDTPRFRWRVGAHAAMLSTWMSAEFHEEHNGVFRFQIQADPQLAEYIKIKKKTEKI